MDELTRRYYAAHSRAIAERYQSIEPQMERQLRRAFVEGMRVLDVGAGSGRDASFLLSLGCNAYGVEPNDALRGVAFEFHPELSERLIAGGLPGLG